MAYNVVDDSLYNSLGQHTYRPGFPVDGFVIGSRDLYNFDPIFDVNAYADRRLIPTAPGTNEERFVVLPEEATVVFSAPNTTTNQIALTATQQQTTPSPTLIAIIVLVGAAVLVSR